MQQLLVQYPSNKLRQIAGLDINAYWAVIVLGHFLAHLDHSLSKPY